LKLTDFESLFLNLGGVVDGSLEGRYKKTEVSLINQMEKYLIKKKKKTPKSKKEEEQTRTVTMEDLDPPGQENKGEEVKQQQMMSVEQREVREGLTSHAESGQPSAEFTPVPRGNMGSPVWEMPSKTAYAAFMA